MSGESHITFKHITRIVCLQCTHYLSIKDKINDYYHATLICERLTKYSTESEDSETGYNSNRAYNLLCDSSTSIGLCTTSLNYFLIKFLLGDEDIQAQKKKKRALDSSGIYIKNVILFIAKYAGIFPEQDLWTPPDTILGRQFPKVVPDLEHPGL